MKGGIGGKKTGWKYQEPQLTPPQQSILHITVVLPASQPALAGTAGHPEARAGYATQYIDCTTLHTSALGLIDAEILMSIEVECVALCPRGERRASGSVSM